MNYVEEVIEESQTKALAGVREWLLESEELKCLYHIYAEKKDKKRVIERVGKEIFYTSGGCVPLTARADGSKLTKLILERNVQVAGEKVFSVYEVDKENPTERELLYTFQCIGKATRDYNWVKPLPKWDRQKHGSHFIEIGTYEKKRKKGKDIIVITSHHNLPPKLKAKSVFKAVVRVMKEKGLGRVELSFVYSSLKGWRDGGTPSPELGTPDGRRPIITTDDFAREKETIEKIEDFLKEYTGSGY